jgi:LPXTG-motif cell wall-anchored protein
VGIVNRRNAVLGWIAWEIGKRVARGKAKAAVPSIDTESKRPNVSAIISALAALGGALWFWRRRKGDAGSESFG